MGKVLDIGLTQEDVEKLKLYYVSEIEEKYLRKGLKPMNMHHNAWATVDPVCAYLLSPDFSPNKIINFRSLLECIQPFGSPSYRRVPHYHRLRFRQLLAAEKALSSPFSELPHYLNLPKLKNPYYDGFTDALCNGVGHQYRSDFVEDTLRILSLWRFRISK